MTDNEHSTDEIDHPVRQGAMLRRKYDGEKTAVLMEVLNRYDNLDGEGYLYEITCPTHTGYHYYVDYDLEDCFEDTGLTNDEPKPVMDDDIRALYQQLHDEHGEHSFHTVHDRETKEPVGEQCMHCRKERSQDTDTDRNGGRV